MLACVRAQTLIQESLFTQAVLCVRLENRFDLHESVNFEVENDFCPGLEMSHTHVILLLDRFLIPPSPVSLLKGESPRKSTLSFS